MSREVPWDHVIYGRTWSSARTVFVEDEREHSGSQISAYADQVAGLLEGCEPGSPVLITADSKVAAFSGQLAAWRAGCVPVTCDASSAPDLLRTVRPVATVDIQVPAVGTASADVTSHPGAATLPADVAAVNLTSGTTGARKAVAVSQQNLLETWMSSGLDQFAPVEGAVASFALPAFDGWWFDTWRTVVRGGSVVALPDVNSDVFSWPDLADRYHVGHALLPAAVLHTILQIDPGLISGIPTLLSGGERFRRATLALVGEAGMTNRFVNLYGPTEATFASHGHVVDPEAVQDDIPIGVPLDPVSHRLVPVPTQPGLVRLVIKGPTVCLGYLQDGRISQRFIDEDGHSSYDSGDLIRLDAAGACIFVGRDDGMIKVAGKRVHTQRLEDQINAVHGVSDSRIVQFDGATTAFIQMSETHSHDTSSRVSEIVREHSTAIGVELVDNIPLKPGGKVDHAALVSALSSRKEI